MKASFIITSVLIPAFNILVFCISAFMDVNPIFAVIPCIIGSVLFGVAGYKLTIEPFVEQYQTLEEAFNNVKRNDQARSEFVYSISQAFEPPVNEIIKTTRELDRLGIAKAENFERMQAEADAAAKKKNYNYFDPNKKTLFDPTDEKNQKIDPNKYKGELIRQKTKDLTNSAEKLGNLAKDIVLFSDVQTKSHVAQGGRFDVDKAVDKVMEVMGKYAGEKDIEIDIDIEDGLYIEGIQERFVAMLQKIVDNAIVYSRKGSRIIIEASSVSGYVVVNVKDEGMGIPPSEIPNVFQNFYRVQRLTDPNPNGAGMGLAIVKQIAELMDAEVKIKSALNVGTTVTLVFKRGID